MIKQNGDKIIFESKNNIYDDIDNYWDDETNIKYKTISNEHIRGDEYYEHSDKIIFQDLQTKKFYEVLINHSGDDLELDETDENGNAVVYEVIPKEITTTIYTRVKNVQ